MEITQSASSYYDEGCITKSDVPVICSTKYLTRIYRSWLAPSQQAIVTDSNIEILPELPVPSANSIFSLCDTDSDEKGLTLASRTIFCVTARICKVFRYISTYCYLQSATLVTCLVKEKGSKEEKQKKKRSSRDTYIEKRYPAGR